MRSILAVAVAGFLGGWSPAASQIPQTTIHDEVVVTATLREEERDEVPAAVEVIDRAEIRARQATRVHELLATVPGLHLVQLGSPGQQVSLFTRGSRSTQALALWNGIPLNNPYFGDMNWAFLPTEGVERVEVVRGPFSALYGSDAVGGVVHVVTRPEPGVRLDLEGGEGSYGRAALAAGVERGSLRLEASGHLRRGEGELDNDFFDSEELFVRGRWRAAEGLEVGVLARAHESDAGIPRAGDRATPERTIAWREREVGLPVTYEQGPWRVEGLLSRVAYTSRFRDPEDPFGFNRADTDSEALRGRVVVTRELGPASWVAAGAEVERLEASDESTFGVNLDAASQRTRALFGQLSHRVGPVRLDVGLRHDDNDVYGSALSPRLGAVWHLSDLVLVRAAYGEAFRAPSLGELFFPGSGNPELEPEESRSVELGVELRPGAWRLGVTAFETRQRHLIDFDFATFTNRNVGRARSRGLEGQVAYRTALWSVRLAGTYLEAEDRDSGLRLLRRPREAASLVVTARPGSWTLTATGRYVGRRPDIDPLTFARAESPSHMRLDLAARYRLSDRLAPYARVENVADRDYAEALGFPAPGRTLVGGVSVRF